MIAEKQYIEIMVGHRHTIRMNGYDYSTSGYYFVTICTHERECLFGEIVDGRMNLSSVGIIVNKILRTLSNRDDLELEEIQIMPNHVHMIIAIVGAHHDAPNEHAGGVQLQERVIRESQQRAIRESQQRAIRESQQRAIRESQERAIRESPLRRSLLSKTIGFLKMNSSKMIHVISPNVRVWQRNYYERIIRDERELNYVRRYIQDNPQNWETDKENLTN